MSQPSSSISNPAAFSRLSHIPPIPLRVSEENVTGDATAEFINPSDSLKDRLALTILGDARKSVTMPAEASFAIGI